MKNDTKTTESEERKSSESEELVLSHGRPVRKHSGSGVDILDEF